MEKRRAIVFIDGSNFYHNSKSLIDKPSKIDFKCLSKFICDKFQLELKEIRYYNAVYLSVGLSVCCTPKSNNQEYKSLKILSSSI